VRRALLSDTFKAARIILRMHYTVRLSTDRPLCMQLMRIV